MKRSGKTAGDDFADNRVPGKGQKRARKSLTDGTELDNQGAPQHILYFSPELQGHGWLRPTFSIRRVAGLGFRVQSSKTQWPSSRMKLDSSW